MRLNELGWRQKISLEEGLELAYEDFMNTSSPRL
jgi:nucleoside-diphosphate-sugar epimerase